MVYEVVYDFAVVSFRINVMRAILLCIMALYINGFQINIDNYCFVYYSY